MCCVLCGTVLAHAADLSEIPFENREDLQGEEPQAGTKETILGGASLVVMLLIPLYLAYSWLR